MGECQMGWYRFPNVFEIDKARTADVFVDAVGPTRILRFHSGQYKIALASI